MNSIDNSLWVDDTLLHIEKQIHHSYLHNSIGAPDIDANRLSLLLLPFQYREKYSELDRSYVSTAMLIQTALDTHEKVSKDESGSLRLRQLTVLAGDYYSGLYYQILSQIPDVKLIRRIAHAIQEINEHKINIMSKNLSLLEDLLSSLKKIESAIISQVFIHKGFEDFVPVAEDMLVLNRLIQEESLYSSGEDSILFSYLARMIPSKTPSVYQEKHLLDLYRDLVGKRQKQIVQKLKELGIPFESLKGSLFAILSPIAVDPKIFVEEG
ncbi:heptaprenyl diphosphate synthase component 1 [Jeotgalibacillus proteolyticus]|nr:heptaprenyl diphosphate synthase component 1 [Jeotgalibacillus proteolyticus]